MDANPGLYPLVGNAEGVALIRQLLIDGNGVADMLGVGHSMEPTLRPGDTLRIERVTGELRPGWIVMFPWKGNITTHRVIELGTHSFHARGDARLEIEGPIDVQDVLGRVAGYRRDNRWHSFEGAGRRAGGLLYNRLMGGLRRVERSWPGLVAIGRNLLRTVGGRAVTESVGRRMFRRFQIDEITRPDQIVCALVSDRLPLSAGLIEQVQKMVSRDDLSLLVARSTRGVGIGSVLLARIHVRGDVRIGLLFAPTLRPFARAAGMERGFLIRLERIATQRVVGRVLWSMSPGELSQRWPSLRNRTRGSLGLVRKQSQLIMSWIQSDAVLLAADD